MNDENNSTDMKFNRDSRDANTNSPVVECVAVPTPYSNT